MDLDLAAGGRRSGPVVVANDLETSINVLERPIERFTGAEPGAVVQPGRNLRVDGGYTVRMIDGPGYRDPRDQRSS